MTTDSDCEALTYRGLTKRLAERDSDPTGDELAAGLAAWGATQASMAFRATSGEAFREVAPYMVGRAAELDALGGLALELLDAGPGRRQALDEGLAQHAEDTSMTDDERRALVKAAGRALEVPFEVMELCLAALRILCVGAPQADPTWAAECAAGAQCLRSALETAYLGVRRTAGRLPQRGWADEELAVAEALRGEAEGLLSEVQRTAEGALA